MTWTRWKKAATTSLCLVALAPGPDRALAYQDPKAEAPNTRDQARPILIRDLDPKLVVRILRETAEAATAEKPERRGVSCLVAIGEVQAKVGDRDGARQTFRCAITVAAAADPKNEDLGKAWFLWQVAQAQTAAEMKADALDTLRQALRAIDAHEDAGRTAETYSEIVKTQAKVGDRAGARETLKKLLTAFFEKGPDQQAAEVVGAQVAAGDFDGAFKAVAKMSVERNFEGSAVRALGQIADSAQLWDRETARKLLKRTGDALGDLKNERRTRQVLAWMAVAQARGGEIQETRRAVRHFVNTSPDMSDDEQYFLSLVTEAQWKAGDAAGAREILRLAYEKVIDRQNHGENGELSGYIAWSQTECGDVAGALRSIAAVKPGIRYFCLVRIALMQARAGDEAAARASLALALRDTEASIHGKPVPAANPPREPGPPTAREEEDDWEKATWLAAVAQIEATAGNVEEAMRTAKTIPSEYWKIHAQETVVSARAEAGDLETALALALTIDEPRHRLIAYEGLAEGVKSRLEWCKLAPRDGR